MDVEVEATKVCFFGGKIRNVGDRFTITDRVEKNGSGKVVKISIAQQLSSSCMKRVTKKPVQLPLENTSKK